MKFCFLTIHADHYTWETLSYCNPMLTYLSRLVTFWLPAYLIFVCSYGLFLRAFLYLCGPYDMFCPCNYMTVLILSVQVPIYGYAHLSVSTFYPYVYMIVFLWPAPVLVYIWLWSAICFYLYKYMNVFILSGSQIVVYAYIFMLIISRIIYTL